MDSLAYYAKIDLGLFCVLTTVSFIILIFASFTGAVEKYSYENRLRLLIGVPLGLITGFDLGVGIVWVFTDGLNILTNLPSQ